MKASMTPRERVLSAINHQQVDRVPIDLGGTHGTTMCTGAYESLKAFLGVNAPTEEVGRAFEWVKMDEAVLARLPVDTRPVFARPPTRSRTRWLDARTFVDDWGITFQKPENRPQWDMVAHPLAEVTIKDLDTYDWPNVEDEGRYAGLRDEARGLHEDTSYAVCGATLDTCIFDRCWGLRGMEQFLVDMLADPEFALALMEKVAQIQFRRHTRFLEQVGPYIDIIIIGDDMGTQNGLLIRPQLYRKMIKPFHKRYVRLIKEHTEARVIMHACGSVVDIIGDYIEIGVDALNPVQATAANMSLQVLKQRFGECMAYWGGIDTQDLLPNGRPEDVRQAVRDTIRTVGLNGGYVLSAVHNIQDDVPPENVWAMLEEASSFRPT